DHDVLGQGAPHETRGNLDAEAVVAQKDISDSGHEDLAHGARSGVRRRSGTKPVPEPDAGAAPRSGSNSTDATSGSNSSMVPSTTARAVVLDEAHPLHAPSRPRRARPACTSRR